MSDDFDWTSQDPAGDEGELPPFGYEGDSDNYDDDAFVEPEATLTPDIHNYREWLESVEPAHMEDELYEAWSLIRDIDEVELENVRGIAFADIMEAFDWMEGIGVLGFSEIVVIDDLFYPVIGASDEVTQI